MTFRPRFAKELRPIVKAALSSGWAWEVGKGGSPTLVSPAGERVKVPGVARHHVAEVCRKQIESIMAEQGADLT